MKYEFKYDVSLEKIEELVNNGWEIVDLYTKSTRAVFTWTYRKYSIETVALLKKKIQ